MFRCFLSFPDRGCSSGVVRRLLYTYTHYVRKYIGSKMPMRTHYLSFHSDLGAPFPIIFFFVFFSGFSKMM